ncbi:MAG: HAD family phosphatase [Anaerolineae bacterium]|nr:HAD family phosphatase [Anaerolineae bacterium]
MSIKLLATDLDGTLIADLHTIPPRTQTAVRAATDREVKVVIATGRDYDITRKFGELLGLTTPIICYQGALIFDPQTGQTIAQEALSWSATHHLIDLARSYKLALNLHVNGQIYTERPTSDNQVFSRHVGTSLIVVDDLKQVLTTPPTKGLIIHPPEQAEAMTAQLQQEFDGRANVFRSLDPLIEVTSPNVSKGRALETLAAYYGIAQSQVMAIGDQDNDVDMIAWAGLGVAMGNASARAKAAADYVVPSLAEEGAAWAIEHFILGQQ